MNKKIKLLTLTVVMFICTFFISAGDVKAEGDGSGYAKCYYQWEERIDNTTGTSANDTVYDFGHRPYVIGIVFYKVGINGNDARSWASIGCGENSTSPGETKEGICTIDNYNDIFHNAKNYIVHFRDGNNAAPKWKCPANIYVNKENGNDRMSVYLTKTACDDANSPWGCSKTIALKDQDIQQSGEVTALDVTGKKADKGEAHTDPSTGQTNDGTTGESDKSDIDGINRWGNTTSPDYSSDEDSCAIISESVQEILSIILWIMSIAGVLILLIMTIIEFVKVITTSEEDGLKGAFKHTVIRAICVIILLLLPTIIGAIIGIANDANIKKDENGNYIIGTNGAPLCNIDK